MFLVEFWGLSLKLVYPSGYPGTQIEIFSVQKERMTISDSLIDSYDSNKAFYFGLVKT